jgi:hypothetical protein
MEEKINRLYYLPKDLVERLKQEPNQSRTVELALKQFFDAKDAGRRIIQTSERLVRLLEDSSIKQPEAQVNKVDERYEWRELVPGMPMAKVDTQTDTFWDPQANQWLSLDLAN